MATVWILNLDAEFEMAQSKNYAPSTAELRGIERGMAQALRSLPAGSRVATIDDVQAGKYAGCIARAWCATPRVREACESGGVALELACDYSVIREVNSRAFSAQFDQDFPNSEFIHSSSLAVDEVQMKLRSESLNWLLKRAYGVASRGQRRMRGNEIQPADVTWIQASLRSGGLQVEPYVSIIDEFSLHGMIEREGCFKLGEPCRVEMDGTGHFYAAHLASPAELAVEERARLIASGQRVAEALSERAYFGPFGIDAFRWKDKRGESRFRGLSEINARYTMGWWLGMGTA